MARRWLEIDSQHLQSRQMSDEAREEQVKAILADKERVAELGRRQASPSWFMRYLCEPILTKAGSVEREGRRDGTADRSSDSERPPS